MATRRDKGSGALFKRADGYWVGGIQLPPGPDGKRRYKRVVRKNRNEAMAALRQLKADLDAGRITTGASTTVEKWLDYWQREILPHRKVTPDTIDSYRSIIKLHLVPALGAKRLDRLHPSDIRTLYTELQDTVSGRCAQKADQVLRLACMAAVRDEVIGANVMDRVDKPLHTAKEAQSFTAATSMHIIETSVATQGTMWGARWALGFTLGAREMEILGLEWDRVDLERGFVDISWQLRRQKKAHGCGEPVAGVYPCGMKRSSFCPEAHWKFPSHMEWRECEKTLVWTRPKTKAGTRIVPLIPAMADVLRGLREGPNPHNLVIHHDDGSPFTQDHDQRMWKKLLIDAQVPHAPQHSVRHSTATLLLEAGVDSHVVQSVIGHSDIAVTRGYQHVDLELARRGWQSLNSVLPIAVRNARVDD